MSTSLRDDEKTGARRLPAKLAQAIDASLDELQRLADQAAPSLGSGSAGAVALPTTKESDLVLRLDTGRDVGVIVLGEMKAVTRTEKSKNDRFHLDLSVSFEGLDAYEVENVQRALTQLRAFITAARQENSQARVTQLLRAVAPPDPLADIELKVAETTADLRREFLERVPVLTSTQLHQRAGFPGANPSATAHRWRKQGKVFSVNHGGRELYPAFQFGADGRPLPIVEQVLAILARDPDRTDWDNALWFAGETGWLDGRTPIELLQSDPDQVKRAAEQEVLRDEP